VVCAIPPQPIYAQPNLPIDASSLFILSRYQNSTVSGAAVKEEKVAWAFLK